MSRSSTVSLKSLKHYIKIKDYLYKLNECNEINGIQKTLKVVFKSEFSILQAPAYDVTVTFS